MDEQIESYWQSYERLCGVETAKNKLFEEMLGQLQKLSHEYQQAKLDYEREQQFNREYQREKAKLIGEIKDFRGQTERASFVLVLIDGDGMIFDDALLQRGELGGKEAAGRLWMAVRENVQRELPDLSSEYKIVTRLYANLKGLGDTCRRAGIVDDSSKLEDFARGFTGSKQLFDFVDVGSGKDRADEKITATLQLNLSNVHCRHIFFGCSHDNGYARLLEDIAQEPNAGKIRLVEGVPFERELSLMKANFANVKFDNLFRNEKINVYQHQIPQNHGYQPVREPSPKPVNGTLNGANGHMPVGYVSPYSQGLARTPSSSTNDSVPQPTWATKAMSAPSVQTMSPPPTSVSSTPVIPRNKYGQRIDPLIKVDPTEYKRVQRIKMCNVHFIRRDCQYGDSCTHDHRYKPTKTDLEILRQVARSTPCHYGTDCDDPKCIYGHRCPHQTDGQKGCRYGQNCKFPEDMHGMDTRVVRTTKV